MERRLGPDRRRHQRGGRRPGDRAGYSPLVMVIDADGSRRDISEAILAKLRFAVVPVDSIERALSILRALRPAAIVCAEVNAADLRDALPYSSIPIVSVGAELATTDALVESVRAAVRAPISFPIRTQ